MTRRTADVLSLEPGRAPGPARYGSPARATVLGWEDADAFEALLDALIEEHAPAGPTERHLVEEIAIVMWRARRIGLAEAAVYRAGLARALDPTASRSRELAGRALSHTGRRTTERAVDAMSATPESNAETLDDLAEDEAMTRTALTTLESATTDFSAVYTRACAALREDTRSWWLEEVEEGNHTDDAAGLIDFIRNQVMPVFDDRRQDIAEQPDIRAQAKGEAFDPSRLQELAKYETHLDRKLERLIVMLLKLQEKRATVGTATSPKGA